MIETTDKNHPILKGVPANFALVDELSHTNAGGTP